ncbi:carboxypeptidase N subunit 2-like isoform X2 [Ochlerotatus camptorhynchus]|uniref:carboxypeptidase N subunit 2-like isoform X2 n=1 Tax=Ochlerotatus camptorhynchus TaxID=644619 RepID=UPI0031E3E26C
MESATSILILVIISSMVAHGLVLECVEGNSGYYNNNQNCTFHDVNIDDISNVVSFRASYYSRYNFQFINSVLIEIPKKIFEAYSSVRTLYVADCGIEIVSRYTFERATELLFLNLSGNILAELNNYVFTGASQLNILDLSYNNISKIEEKAFNNLNVLTTLFLTGNKLKALNDDVFSHLPNMRKLYAAKNELQTLQSGLFQFNTLLTMLFLQSNQLVFMDKDLFSGVNEMDYLWLSNNSLTSFDFNGLKVKRVNLIRNKLQKVKLSPNVEKLYLNNNSISEITADDFKELKLTLLSVTWNNLTSMDGIDEISSLEVLDLSHNKIGALKLSSFASLKNLADLNLEDTKITNLQHGTFSQLTLLKRLDISYNNLNRIDLDIFTSSHLIQEMFIEGNRLKEINYEELRKIFPSLSKISIADNNWNCSFLTRMIRSLNTQSIAVGGFKSENLIADKTNVKGIYCTDSTNPLNAWNITAQHLDKYLNSTAPIFDSTEIKQIMQNAIDDISKFNEQRAAIANKSDNIEGEIYDLTKKLLSLENQIIDVKKSILDVQMSQLANATNETYVSNDLKKIMLEINELTLSKLKQTKEEMEFKYYQQSFKNDKLEEKITSTAEKLILLSKQIDQTRSSSFLSHNSMELKAPSTTEAASGSSGSTQIMMVLILIALIALIAIVVMAIYRNRLPFGRKRGERYGTSNTLATMVDDM